MRGPGLREATRRTGLTRRQLRYLEEHGELGEVARLDGRTVYSAQQLEFLEHVARLRQLDLRMQEAAQIAHELQQQSAPSVPTCRLDELITVALERAERHSRLGRELAALRARRTARAS